MLPGLFDEQFLLRKLDQKGDPLARLNSVVDWQVFLPIKGACCGGFWRAFSGAVGADFSADVLASCTRTPLFPADLAGFCPVDASLLLCLSS